MPRHGVFAGAPDLGDGAVAGPYLVTKTGRPRRRTRRRRRRRTTRSDRQFFYADAGDRAALAAVAVVCFASTSPTVFRATEPERDGAETNVVPRLRGALAPRSGGALFCYGGANAAGDDAAFAAGASRRVPRARRRAARRGVRRRRPLHARVRVSAELAGCAAGGGIMPDETYEGLFHVPRCAPGDCFAFGPSTSRRAGSAEGRLPAHRADGVRVPQIESCSKTREPSASRGGVRRVCTRQAAVAATPAETHASADAEATFGVLYRKILDAAEEDGVAGARASRGLARRAAAAPRMRRADGRRRRRRREYKSLVRAGCLVREQPALRRAGLTHAALARSAALAVPGFTASCFTRPREGPHSADDARVAAFWTHRRLGPGALARATYPEITAWRADGAFLTSRDDDAAAYASDAVSPREGRLNAADEEAKSKNEPASFSATIVRRRRRVSRRADPIGQVSVRRGRADTIVVFQAPTQPGSPAALAAFPPARGAPARARRAPPTRARARARRLVRARRRGESRAVRRGAGGGDGRRAHARGADRVRGAAGVRARDGGARARHARGGLVETTRAARRSLCFRKKEKT